MTRRRGQDKRGHDAGQMVVVTTWGRREKNRQLTNINLKVNAAVSERTPIFNLKLDLKTTVCYRRKTVFYQRKPTIISIKKLKIYLWTVFFNSWMDCANWSRQDALKKRWKKRRRGRQKDGRLTVTGPWKPEAFLGSLAWFIHKCSYNVHHDKQGPAYLTADIQSDT